jgi:hypothetical protein
MRQGAAIGDLPDGTMLGKLSIRERKKIIKLAGLETADAKIHSDLRRV